MATAGAVRAGRAFVEAYLDDTRLERGLRTAQSKLKKWGKAVTAMGAALTAVGSAAAAPFVYAAKHFASAGDAMSKMSQRTGIAVAELSALEYAASQSGASAEDLEKGVRNMQRTLFDAGRRGKEAQDSLRGLGLSLSDLAGKSPDQQFKVIAEQLAKVEDPGRRAALAMRIFGRAGTQLLPLMADGARGIEALEQRARDLGVVMQGEDAEAAVVLGDLWADLVRILKHGAFVIGAALAPTLIRLVNGTSAVASSVLKWVDANRPLFVTIAKVIAAVLAAGAVLTALGVAIVALGAVLGGLATIVGTVGTVLGAIASAIGFLLSPIGLVIAAVAAMAVWFVRSSGIAGGAIEWLKSVFGPLVDEARAAFDAIAAALSGGDLAAAAQVLWATLKLEWTKGTAVLTQKWVAARGVMQDIWSDMTRALSKAWVDFLVGFQIAWRKAQDAISNGILEIMGLFDSSLDVSAAQAEIAAMSRADLAPVLAGGEATKREIDAQHERDAAARKERADSDISEAQAELDRARAEFDAAVMVAKASGAGPEDGGPAVPDWLAGLLEQLDGGMDVAAGGAQGAGGTFSSEAARIFAQGQDPLKSIEESSRETARNTRKMRDNQLNYG